MQILPILQLCDLIPFVFNLISKIKVAEQIFLMKCENVFFPSAVCRSCCFCDVLKQVKFLFSVRWLCVLYMKLGKV